MKEYIKPEIEMITFNTEEIATTGNISGDDDGIL